MAKDYENLSDKVNTPANKGLSDNYDRGVKTLSGLIRGYFDLDGMQIQFNVVSNKQLRAAQKNPEKYKDLLIRVAGYSAFFVELDKRIQEDIIDRTEHIFC